MFIIKTEDIDELMQISRHICIFTYLQSLVRYDISNHIVNINSYHLLRQEVLDFISDNQENCAADLRQILRREDFLQPLHQ